MFIKQVSRCIALTLAALVPVNTLLEAAEIQTERQRAVQEKRAESLNLAAAEALRLAGEARAVSYRKQFQNADIKRCCR